MRKHPALNAAAAAVYIVLIVQVMGHLSRIHPEDDMAVFSIMPIAFLSLFTLSASVMGYLFLGNPIMLYLDGKKKEAVTFFMQTVAVFALITLGVLTLLFLKIV